jgi:hypothetical protein
MLWGEKKGRGGSFSTGRYAASGRLPVLWSVTCSQLLCPNAEKKPKVESDSISVSIRSKFCALTQRNSILAYYGVQSADMRCGCSCLIWPPKTSQSGKARGTTKDRGLVEWSQGGWRALAEV